jgi:hypothetical protein
MGGHLARTSPVSSARHGRGDLKDDRHNPVATIRETT